MARDQKTLTYRVRRLPSNIEADGVTQILRQLLATEDGVPIIRVFSLARNLDAAEVSRSKVATVTISQLPAHFQGHSEWSFQISFEGDEYCIILDLHFLDFTVLNEVNDDDHVLDCVAISGLASHPFGSWQQRGNENSFMWLRDGLPKDLPGVRTITYGYDTQLSASKSFQSTYDIAMALVNRLTSVGFGWRSAKPIVFLAHSLGGIVLKEALVILAPSSGHETSILEKIKAILLFGVPNAGMETAQLKTMVKGDPTEGLIQDLSPRSKYLLQIDSLFSGLQYTRRFPVISFYETKTSKAVHQSANGSWSRNGPDVIMVEKESAIQKCSNHPHEVHPIDEDHSAMVKFAIGDVNYACILDCLRGILRQEESQVARSFSRKSTIANISDEATEAEGRDIGIDTLTNRRDVHIGMAKQHSSADILKSLWLEVLDRRLTDISAQYQSTFEWMFSDDSLEFVPWLHKGNGAYWVEGKPGAGKSTLMKYVFKDKRTKEFLELWSQSGTLVQASFFFHHRGSTVQKSFEGLLQSILHQILKEVPKLCRNIPLSFLLVQDKRQISWSLSSLRQAFLSIQRQQETKLDLCLFIDALDEFDGHLELISEFMKSLIDQERGSAVRCKICFSSRPRQIIQNSFGQYPNFRIHEHTEGDIRTYTEGRLTESPDLFKLLKSTGKALEQAASFSDKILRKAEGVFLWVRLALDDIVKVLSQQQSSSINDFESVLQQVPPELDEFYKLIIERIPQDFRWEAYITLEILLRDEAELALEDIHHITTCLGYQTTRECYAQRKRLGDKAGLSIFLRKLKDECGGLIEIDEEERRIQLMHETVRTFVNRPTFKQLMFGQNHIFRPQNGYTELAKFYLTGLQYFNGDYNDGTLMAESRSLKYWEDKLSPRCMRYCYMAEKSTGTCQYELMESFIPSRSSSPFAAQLRSLITSGISFAVFSNLLLYMQRKLELPPNTSSVNSNLLFYMQYELELPSYTSGVNSDPEVSLLFCLCEGTTLLSPAEYEYSLSEAELQRNDMTPMAKLLLDHRADIQALYQGETPLGYLLVRSYHCDDLQLQRALDVAQLLINHGHDPNCNINIGVLLKPWSLKKGSYGNTQQGYKALHIPILPNEMAKLMLRHKADVNARSRTDMTPIDIAIREQVRGDIFLDRDRMVMDIKRHIDFLIQNKGLITRKGLRYLPKYIEMTKYDFQHFHSLLQDSKEEGFLSSSDLFMFSLSFYSRKVSYRPRALLFRKW